MSSDLCSELETVMRPYGLPAATPFQGFHVLYMGAAQDKAFRDDYYATNELKLRVVCVRLFFALPCCMADAFDDIIMEEMGAATKYIPDFQALNTDDKTRRDFAGRRLGMLWLIKQKAAKLFSAFRSRPDFPSFATLQAISADHLAAVWADRFDLDKLLARANALGGEKPTRTNDVEYIEDSALGARWLARCVKDFIHADTRSSPRVDANREASEWWPALLEPWSSNTP